MHVTRPRHARWSVVAPGFCLLLLGGGVGLLGLRSADSRPQSVPLGTTGGHPLLILRGGVAPFAGTLGGHAALRGTISPGLPGLNTLALRIDLPGGHEARGGHASLVLTMPGMALAARAGTVTASSQGYRGRPILPMFGRYRAQVHAITANGRYSGAVSVALPLTLASPPAGGWYDRENTMKTYSRNHAGSLVLLGVLSLTSIAVSRPAYAGQVTPPGTLALSLAVDKPIIHLGESVRVSGHHFTPGASVTISLHGPQAATLGPVYASVRVAQQGDFSVRIAIPGYPDTAAHEWHTIIVAAVSTAMVTGAQEGAAVAVQADPMPSLSIVTRARLVRTALVIDGTAVPAVVTAGTASQYRISYTGHLRAGVHSAYLTWSDAAGRWGARTWSFRIGSPYAVSAAPSLHLSAQRLHLGESLTVAGAAFTPGALVTISLGGPNAPPSVAVARALVDATGTFQVLIRIAHYPSAAARAASAIEVSVTARGGMVGDLPEGVAVPVRVVERQS